MFARVVNYFDIGWAMDYWEYEWYATNQRTSQKTELISRSRSEVLLITLELLKSGDQFWDMEFFIQTDSTVYDILNSASFYYGKTTPQLE